MRLAVLAITVSAFSLLLACPSAEPEPAAPEPGPFVAGHASARLPAPLGIGTAGSSPLSGPDSDSPYTVRFPATTKLHGHPDVRVVALSRGEGFEVVLARVDTIAAPQQIRDAVVAELLARTGRDYDDALVLSGTHSHNGPGRFIQGSLFALVAGEFWPAYYDRFIDTVASTIEAALADMGPAELGHATAQCPDAHSDRRCEDGPFDGLGGYETYTNDDTPTLVIKKDGQVDAVVVNYAVHGTLLGLDDLTLSQDVSGAIEHHVQLGFDHPVMAMFMNHSAADITNRDPGDDGMPVSAWTEKYHRLDRIGAYVAERVVPLAESASTNDQPAVRARTARFAMNRDALGYSGNRFDYDYGAVYCDKPAETSCSEDVYIDDLDELCIPFPEENPAPDRTVVTVGQLGDAHFTTWGGECGTLLAEAVIGAMQAHDGVDDVFFFGYANDYLGYQLQEDDWWRGGYEASGGMWGPRQGDYTAEMQARAFSAFLAGEEPDWQQPGASALFDSSGGQAYEPEEALQFGELVQPAADEGLVRFSVNGSDPWLGTPLATLQVDDGGWRDVLGGNGLPFTSDGMAFEVAIETEPAWSATTDPTPRVFRWRFTLPTAQRELTLEPGSYRLSVQVPTGAGSELIETEAFSVP